MRRRVLQNDEEDIPSRTSGCERFVFVCVTNLNSVAKIWLPVETKSGTCQRASRAGPVLCFSTGAGMFFWLPEDKLLCFFRAFPADVRDAGRRSRSHHAERTRTGISHGSMVGAAVEDRILDRS